MRQLVLHGFPTTTMRTDDAAYRWMALPSSTKIGPFLRIRSPRSIPGPRGTDPTRSTQSAWSCVSARSADALTRSSSGYAPSSSSMSTPLALSIICGMSARRRSISVSGPNISPDAIRGRSAYATWPVAPVTTTLMVLDIRIYLAVLVAVRDRPSQSSKRVSPSRASSPGTSVRSLSIAPK